MTDYETYNKRVNNSENKIEELERIAREGKLEDDGYGSNLFDALFFVALLFIVGFTVFGIILSVKAYHHYGLIPCGLTVVGCFAFMAIVAPLLLRLMEFIDAKYGEKKGT